MNKKPTAEDIKAFSDEHDRLTVQVAQRIVDYGKAMISVMNDTGVTPDFDFKGMAIVSVKTKVKGLLDELEGLEFEHYEVGDAIKEITRPYGS